MEGSSFKSWTLYSSCHRWPGSQSLALFPLWPSGLLLGSSLLDKSAFILQLLLYSPHPPSSSGSCSRGFLTAHPLLGKLSLDNPSQHQFHALDCPSLPPSPSPKSQWSLSSLPPLWHIPKESPKPLDSSFMWFLMDPLFPSLISLYFCLRC